MTRRSRYRWFVIAVFFVFMLLHQSDRLLIGPLTTNIMGEFNISRTEMGAVTTGALLVEAILYPIWGYLYDRYARAKLLALASAIWGVTTWLNALARRYTTFLFTRAATGIDDSSYPGLFSLVSDYFEPKVRGKIYGLLQLTQPLGYLIGTVLALALGSVIGWRNVFLITGTLGLVVAAFIFFGVREPPRGRSEPELANLNQIGVYRFDRKLALQLFRKRALWPLWVQGFFGVFPWEVITFWFFNYLQTERGYAEGDVFIAMVPAVLVLAAGYFVGGSAGDYLFKRTPRGRLIVCTVGVIVGAVLLSITMNVPHAERGTFAIMLVLTALFIPFASPNVIASVYDITLPEVRSTAMAVQSFIEKIGSALAPLMAGAIADQSTLKDAILIICLSAWAIGAVFLIAATAIIPRDIETLRHQLRERAEQERARQAAAASS